jgi:hypothetical protein
LVPAIFESRVLCGLLLVTLLSVTTAVWLPFGY